MQAEPTIVYVAVALLTVSSHAWLSDFLPSPYEISPSVKSLGRKLEEKREVVRLLERGHLEVGVFLDRGQIDARRLDDYAV